MSYFAEFCCRNGGSNLNAGTLNGDLTEPGITATKQYTSGTWVQATRVFTPSAGNPVADGIAVGNFASVFPDGSSGDAVYIGKVSAVSTTTITIDASQNQGTAPVDGSGNRTLRIGGAWRGPNGASGFPFNFITSTPWNFNPRVNLKNDQTYNITAPMTTSNGAQMMFQGYSTAYGDFGRATIDGGVVGASYTLWALNGNPSYTADIIFQNNGATGSADLVSGSGFLSVFRRCVFAHSRGNGLASAGNSIQECEAYDCNQSNTVGCGGFSGCGGMINCISHDNTGANSFGFSGFGPYYQCIADTNGGVGFVNPAAWNCDSYNNGGDGFTWANCVGYLHNSNSIKNGGWGFNFGVNVIGGIATCRYGAGTQANVSGGLNLNAAAAIEVLDVIAYASNVTPWTDPANGDFRINLAAAQNTGRGNYTQIAPGFGGTLSHPDIGAVQHQTATGGGGLFTNPGMTGGLHG